MGSQFVLHDDEFAPSTVASVFEVEQPTLGTKQVKYTQRVQRPAADALSEEDQVPTVAPAVSVLIVDSALIWAAADAVRV